MLAGKLVICTGGSSGIGRATARVLTREGAKVVATGMRLVGESAQFVHRPPNCSVVSSTK